MRILIAVLLMLTSSFSLCVSGWAEGGYCGQLKEKGLTGKRVVVYPIQEEELKLTFGTVVEVDQDVLVLDAVRMQNKMYDPNLAYGNHGENGRVDRTRAYINCKNIFSIAVMEDRQEKK